MTQNPNGFAALGLHPQVLSALVTVGYEEPSPIQAQAIPIVLAGNDIIGQAQTGTGKTAAFALPLLSKIDLEKQGPQVLVLAPTRELALQVATAFETYSAQLAGVKIVAIYGGAPMGPQLKALRQGAQIVVATPGRLVDHLGRNSHLLSGIRHLVLDEADEMLKLGFMDDLEIIFQAIPANRQTILFSATLPHSIRAIADKYLHEPQHIKIAAKTQTVARIEQAHVMIHADQKVDAVLRLLEVENFDALIGFVRTKQATLDVAGALEAKGYKVAPLNGDIAQNQREWVIESLKDGRLDIVIATDVAARGIDVPRITHVLNIDMPYDPESYVHRIGRTGRAGRAGRALLLVTPRERRMLQVIERATKQKVEEVKIPGPQQILDARIRKLTESLVSLVPESESVYGELLDQLTASIGCTSRELASALLCKATKGQSLNLMEISQEHPLFSLTAPSAGRNARPHKRESRVPICSSGNRIRCRTPLGARDGVAAKNLLGAILNEGGLARDAIGRIQIKEAFSLIELPVDGVDQVLSKLKNTRVAGKLLKLRRYREDC